MGIDWDSYKKALPAQAAWVADFEKQFNATSIPKPVDRYSSAINADDSKEAIEELAILANLPPVAQMTMADIYKFLPELNAQSEAEMEANGWEPGAHSYLNPDLVTKDEEDAKAVRAEVKSGFFAAKKFW